MYQIYHEQVNFFIINKYSGIILEGDVGEVVFQTFQNLQGDVVLHI